MIPQDHYDCLTKNYDIMNNNHIKVFQKVEFSGWRIYDFANCLLWYLILC